MFRKFLRRLEHLGWKKKGQTTNPLDLLIEQEEKDQKQQQRQQVATQPRIPGAVPQIPGTVPQSEPGGYPPQQQPVDNQADIEKEAREMVSFIRTFLAGKSREEVAEQFPEKWNNETSLRTFGNLLDHAEQQGWGLGNWVEGWVSEQITGVLEEEPATVNEDAVIRQQGLNEEVKPFHTTFRQMNKDKIDAMESAPGGKEKTDAFFSMALSPRVQTTNRRIMDNRVEALLRNSTVFNGVLTYPSFVDRLQKELAANNMDIDNVQQAISNKSRATKLDIDHTVMRDMMSSTGAGSQDGIHEILLDLSQPQSDPVRQAAHEALWKYWNSIYAGSDRYQNQVGGTSLDVGVGTEGTASLGDMIDLEEQKSKQRGQRIDPEQDATELQEATEQLKGLSIPKVKKLEDISKHLSGFLDSIHKLTHKGKPYKVSRNQMMNAYMGAVSSQISNLLKPGNKDAAKDRTKKIRDYNRGLPGDKQIREQTPAEAEAVAKIEAAAAASAEADAAAGIERKSRYSKGYGSLGVNLVSKDGGGSSMNFDFSRLVDSESLFKYFGERAVAQRHVAKAKLDQKLDENALLDFDSVRVGIAKELGVEFDDDFKEKFSDDYLKSFLEMSQDEIDVIEIASTDKTMTRTIRDTLKYSWSKTWDYIFDTLNEVDPATGNRRFTDEQIRMFTDTIGLHGKFARPDQKTSKTLPSDIPISTKKLREKFGEDWHTQSSYALSRKLFPFPKDKNVAEDLARKNYLRQGARYLAKTTGIEGPWEYKDKKWRLIDPQKEKLDESKKGEEWMSFGVQDSIQNKDIPVEVAISQLGSVVPSVEEPKNKWNYTNNEMQIPRDRWIAAMKGDIAPENVEKIYTHLYHRPIPKDVQEWIDFTLYNRKGKKRSPKGKAKGAVKAKNTQSRSRYENMRRIYADGIKRIASLIQMRNRLSKFAAKDVIENLISRDVKKVRKDLHWR